MFRATLATIGAAAARSSLPAVDGEGSVTASNALGLLGGVVVVGVSTAIATVYLP